MVLFRQLRNLVVFSCICGSHSFQNSALRFLFRKMTPDCNWPEKKDAAKPLEECSYYDPEVEFPEYYLRDFHAYTGGNLNPRAAKEAMSATSAVMKHHFEHLTGDESSHYVRSVFSVLTRTKNVESFATGSRSDLNPIVTKPQKIVDFGCGIGVSTSYLKDSFREDDVTGFDLSPFFLEETSLTDVGFHHGNVEDLSSIIEPDSVDVVSISYVLHELPYEVSKKVIREAYRILKPGTGVLSILDMHNPKASSPMMKYIFDRTEPYLKEYSILTQNMKTDLERTGFGEYEVSTGFPKTIMWFARKER